VGLGAKRGARIRTLSGGQRRRLDVALGIIGRPELLFLDEPTTGFDPEARCQFWELIEDLRRDGTTIVLTTHYLEEAERLADRVAVIAGGLVVACDTPAGLCGGATVVSWRDPAGARRRQETPTPALLVTQLASALGGEIPELTVAPPRLQDAYLRLLDHAPHSPGAAA
jgi:ABC-2 type transport system ATP-binding protein